MDTINALREVFDLLSQPVFFTRDKTIAYCNCAATRSMFCEGEPLTRYLDEAAAACITGDTPVQLLLTAAGRSCWATARPVDGGLLFVLEPDEMENLRPDALLPLSNAVAAPLNELMSAVRGLRAILSESEDAAGHKQLSVIMKNCYRLLRVSKNLPAMRDVLSDDDVVCRQRGDLRDLLTALADQARPLLEARGLTLNCAVPDEPVEAWYDSLRLRRALLNLLNNSMKFTPSGGVLTLRLDTFLGYARIVVEDNGRGFDPDVLASAFRRYDRRVDLDAYEWGVGFGLPIVRSVAENHGGTVLIRSAPGQGAQVYLTVKLGQPAKDQTVATIRTRFDYTGGLNASLLELSDGLPADCYD